MALARDLQQACGIQMTIRILDCFKEDLALPGEPDAANRQFLEQRASF